MHRVPLRLPAPSVSWNRALPEHLLFEHTLNSRNLDECESFLTILESETRDYKNLCYSLGKEQLKVVDQLMANNNCETVVEELRLLNNIVLRTPKDSEDLTAALKVRGGWFFQRCCFDGAANDYTMFLHVHKRSDAYEELCEVHGTLVICYYLMRQYDKTKKHLRFYNKYKAKLPGECFVNTQLEKIASHITNFASELDDVENVVPKCADPALYNYPFKGFNADSNIRCISAACHLIDNKQNKKKQTPGIYTNYNIQKDSIILLEKPMSHSISAPLIQCELCLYQSDQVYTCLDCRYKTYCSLKCIEKDKELHRYECAGYQCLLLYILDCKDLYRLFISVSTFLNDNIFSQKLFRKLTSAAAVLEKAEKLIEEKDIIAKPYLHFVRTKPCYRSLSDSQYSTLVATAFRLTMFIEKKTFIFDAFYKKLRLHGSQKSIVVGVILMRLHAHLLLNTLDFEYYYPLSVIKPRYESMRDQIADLSHIIQPVRESDMENVNKYYNAAEAEVIELSMRYMQSQTDEQTEAALNTVPLLELSQICNSIERPISTFKDKLAELYFNPDNIQYFMYGEGAGVSTTERQAVTLCCHIAEMGDLERCKFVRTFVQNFHIHFIEYFYQMNMRFNQVHQVLSLLCTNLRKFRHACVPNVEVVLLENGLLVGRTVREIKEGEELLVSYKAHYMRHNRSERKAFLRLLNIECQCPCCEMPEAKEPTNIRQGIYCEKCNNTVITPSQKKCPKCNTDYRKMLGRYRTEILMLEEEILRLMQPNADDRKRYLLYTLSYLRARKYFLPCHESRIRVELKLARYLAMKNFAMESYRILMDVKDNVLQDYEENLIWFSFYNDILVTAKIILYYSVDEMLNPLPMDILEELWKLGIYIINGQRSHICLFKTFNYDKSRLLEELRQFLRWKEKLQCTGALSNVNLTYLGNEYDNLTEEDEMPQLIQIIP